MFRKNFYLIIIFFLISNSMSFSNSINISVIVDDQIITNYDIEKEGEYLKILNPNLSNLKTEKIEEIAKESLINEIIKKKEFEKLIDFEKVEGFTEELTFNKLLETYPKLLKGEFSGRAIVNPNK